jgi:TPR repeat protein
MYYEGRGVPRDEAKAKALYHRACQVGNNAACRLVPTLRDGMPIGP